MTKIGNGAFGSVTLAKIKKNDEHVFAVKVGEATLFLFLIAYNLILVKNDVHNFEVFSISFAFINYINSK